MAIRVSRVLAAGVLLSTAFVTAFDAREARNAASQNGGVKIVSPTRKSVGPQGPTDPPSVPAAADTLGPLTMQVRTVRRAPGHEPVVSRQTVYRTRDRVLIRLDEASEWLFVRNPVDNRRVTGYLIEHATRRIVVHDDSALRNTQQIRGWRDVFMLRFDPSVLDGLLDAGEERRVGAVSVMRYSAPDSTSQGIVDVWWSPAALFASAVTTRQGAATVTSTVETLQEGVPDGILAVPSARVPTYETIDIADALERH